MDVRNWVKDNEANSYIILGICIFNVAERISLKETIYTYIDLFVKKKASARLA